MDNKTSAEAIRAKTYKPDIYEAVIEQLALMYCKWCPNNCKGLSNDESINCLASGGFVDEALRPFEIESECPSPECDSGHIAIEKAVDGYSEMAQCPDCLGTGRIKKKVRLVIEEVKDGNTTQAKRLSKQSKREVVNKAIKTVINQHLSAFKELE